MHTQIIDILLIGIIITEITMNQYNTKHNYTMYFGVK